MIDRPVRPRLSTAQITEISIYWLAINALWGGLAQLIPQLTSRYICGDLSTKACAAAGADIQPAFGGVYVTVATAAAIVGACGVVMAVVVQPLAGAISDYTMTRWGRRKPYIVIGTLLDVAFLAGLSVMPGFVPLLVFVVLLQFSSNFAQGPFQGYVPDLVPGEQVSTASAAMGLMIVIGNVTGVGLAALAIALGNYPIALIGLAVLELTTMTLTVSRVREPRDLLPVDRPARSIAGVWEAIREVTGHRSYMWLLGSRLFILMTTGMVTGEAFFFMTRSLGLSESGWSSVFFVVFGIVALMTLLATVPAARLSDRVGRKRVIYLACLIGFVGLAAFALVPGQPRVGLAGIEFPVLSLVIAPVGIAAGMFLTVDWALMTDIIPKRTAGRYMGLSNVVTGTAGTFSLLAGGVVIDVVDAIPGAYGWGPRLAMLLAASFYVVGAALLTQVDERRVEAEPVVPGAEPVPEPRPEPA